MEQFARLIRFYDRSNEKAKSTLNYTRDEIMTLMIETQIWKLIMQKLTVTVLTTLVFLTSTSASAQWNTSSAYGGYNFDIGSSSTTFRDSIGQRIGTANTYGNSTTFRDSIGQRIGTGNTYGNSTTFRDSIGRRVGTANTYGNSTTFRDSIGRRVGTATKYDY
jgi:hypothetical protein